MSAALHEPADLPVAVAESDSTAPPLPIEQHIVGAALAAEQHRTRAEQAVLILRHAPRNAAAFAEVHGAALTAWCELDEQYRAYQAVLECKGQA